MRPGSGWRLSRRLARCGGDDFDRALYHHCDEQARVAHGVGINGKGLDLQVSCRVPQTQGKPVAAQSGDGQRLSSGNLRFRHAVTRAAFEELIAASINRTASLTGNLVAAARHQAHPVDTAILIGGSSRIPLVAQSLSGTLPFAPQRSQHQDVAVALGAAYHGWQIWPERTPFPPPPPAIATAPEHVITFGDPIRDLVVSRDGKTFAVAIRSKEIQVWDAERLKVRHTLIGHREPIRSIALEPLLERLYSTAEDRRICIWDIEKECEIMREVKADFYPCLALSTNGTFCGIGGRNTLEIRNSGNLSVIKSYKTGGFFNENWTLSLEFSPKGNLLASAHQDKTVRLWSISENKPVSTLSGHKDRVRSVRFSHDGKLIASGSEDRTVKIWDVASGRGLVDFSGFHAESLVSGFCRGLFSNRHWNAGGSIVIRSLPKGQELGILRQHGATVNGIAFVASLGRLISASADKKVIIWR